MRSKTKMMEFGVKMFRAILPHRMARVGTALVIGLASAPLAMATTTPPTEAVPTTPERTVSTFGDWTLTCVQKATAPRSCEAGMAVQDQRHQLVLALAIGRPSKDVPQQLVVQVPINVRVTAPMRLAIDAAEPVAVPFINCNRLGCFAQLTLKDDAVLRRLRNRPVNTPGRIEWQDSTGTAQSLPLSTRGVSAALDALAATDK